MKMKLTPTLVDSAIRTIAALVVVSSVAISFTHAADLNLLFIGDNGPHQPARRFAELAPALEQRGIAIKYTDRMVDVNPETLAKFDGVVLVRQYRSHR